MADFPDYKTVATSALIPYARNSRTHSDEQVAQIAASIREFGFTNPVLIDGEKGIIAGHGRVLAARKLGMDDVPCIELSHLTEAQKRAYVIADNKLALNSGWDEEMLALELGELGEASFDLELTGFSLDEIASIFDDSEQEDTEPTEQSYAETFSIVVECESEEEQERIFNRLDSEGYKCRVQSL